ncbi:uncharacterized protein LOC124364163 isoform X14 [Homalodisca vitripennis]|uniref:uncharacterized protein LOC124364163 isoform X14 n=1 Tax=Homalodisca vitripennis TaxID=197043 RepID=UPI001EE9E0C8|nr:uncharacterized protein LOC124364163 isoform X14 [Homalodisca vitripennis]
MVDLIPERIWSWVVEGWRNMADLADKIDDMICTFEGEGETTMDTVAMYMFGWMMFGLVVLGIGKFVYGNFVANKDLKTQNVIVEPPVTVTKSENSVVDAAVKQPPKDIVVKSSGGGKYVPPTPPSRKRLGSRSGRPVVGPAKPKSTNLIHPPPTATGPESESVKWVNELFFWLYSDLVIVNELLSVWIQSLNDFTKKSVDEHGVGAEFVRVLGETQTPVLSNVFCECAPNDDVTITCDCEATPALQLKVFRQKGEKVEVSHYRVNVNRFRARLSIFCITEKLLADVKCDGWPDIKVSLAQVGAIKNNMDESQLQEVITEIVTVALRNTEVHFNLSQYPTCPRLNRYVPPPSHLLPVHYDSLLNSSHSMSINSKTADKRLLVKVVKAVGLGCKKGVQEPFCIVELDEPPQKNQTSLKKDTDSPVWDEHFLFDISGHTSEILFEVYDRAQGENKFLGLAIVGVEELLINPSQRQTISLQSRPYQEDTVSGMLTLEFLFIEGADLPQMGDKPFKLKETLKSVSPSGKTVTTTKTVFAKPGPTTEHLTNGGDGVTDSALRDLELRNKGPPTQTSKSTLIIHSVQRQPQKQLLKVEQTRGGRWHEVAIDDQQGMRETTGPGGTQGQHVHILQPSDNQAEGYLSVPPREGSTRSSLSEASGISGASNRTYINEASTLVLETIENGIKKYYLVPLSIAQKSKWKKKGTKLHIFNDHTFIAKHLPGGTQCQVCSKVLPRRLGKQGYECRDCQLKCHKMCHIRADNTCPSSNIQSIELCADASSPYSVRRLMRQTQPQR